jgi:hypothetical protein
VQTEALVQLLHPFAQHSVPLSLSMPVSQTQSSFLNIKPLPHFLQLYPEKRPPLQLPHPDLQALQPSQLLYLPSGQEPKIQNASNF